MVCLGFMFYAAMLCLYLFYFCQKIILVLKVMKCFMQLRVVFIWFSVLEWAIFCFENVGGYYVVNTKNSTYYVLVRGIKNGATTSFSFQSKILPKLKAQILQMRYWNVHEGSDFAIYISIAILIITFFEILSFQNGLNHNFTFSICFYNSIILYFMINWKFQIFFFYSKAWIFWNILIPHL